jgi:hypothetical protein
MRICRVIARRPIQRAGQCRQCRITAQLVVVDQVLVAEHEADDARHRQRLYLVLDEAGLRESVKQPPNRRVKPDDAIGSIRKQRIGMRRGVSLA